MVNSSIHAHTKLQTFIITSCPVFPWTWHSVEMWGAYVSVCSVRGHMKGIHLAECLIMLMVLAAFPWSVSRTTCHGPEASLYTHRLASWQCFHQSGGLFGVPYTLSFSLCLSISLSLSRNILWKETLACHSTNIQQLYSITTQWTWYHLEQQPLALCEVWGWLALLLKCTASNFETQRPTSWSNGSVISPLITSTRPCVNLAPTTELPRLLTPFLLPCTGSRY